MQRAEAADDKCLPVPALLAFADVVAASNAAFRAGVVTSDQLFFQAACATFADASGKVPAAALPACTKVAYLGAPPKEAEAVAGGAASPVSTEEFAAQLRAEGVPLPDYSHRQVWMRPCFALHCYPPPPPFTRTPFPPTLRALWRVSRSG